MNKRLKMGRDLYVKTCTELWVKDGTQPPKATPLGMVVVLMGRGV